MDRSTYDGLSGWGTFSEITTRTPGFWKLVKQGAHLPDHEYFWHRIDAVDPYAMTYEGYRRYKGNFLPLSMRDCLETERVMTPIGVPFRSIDGFGSVKNHVTNVLGKKVRGTEVDLGVMLGEYKETAATVTSGMRAVSRMIPALKRGDVRGVTNALRSFAPSKRLPTLLDGAKEVSNFYLLLKYGVLPVVKDCWDAVDVYQKRYKQRAIVKTVTYRAGRQIDELIVNSAPNPDPAFQGRVRSSRLVCDFTIRGVIKFEATNPLLRTLDQCGVSNPLSVAWELVPLSFVVDWFIPVNDFLQGIVPPLGVDFDDGYLSVKAQGGITTISNSPAPQYSGDMFGYSVSSQTRETYKQRHLLNGFPGYRILVPDLSLSKGQLASALALLIQRVRTPG